MQASCDRTVRLGGFAISDSDFACANRRINASLESKAKLAVFFANTHFVVACQPLRRKFAQVGSVLILNDGLGLSLARHILFKTNFSENLNGTDFIPRLLAESLRPLRIYLLGASPAAVSGCAAHLRQIPQAEVVGFCDGYSLWGREQEIVAEINAAKPDILLVGLGSPLQERFVLDHFAELDVPVTFAVGALFDFLSGEQARAPLWMRRAGFEWLHRLWREPRRLAYRYTFEIMSFLRLVFADAAGGAPMIEKKADPTAR